MKKADIEKVKAFLSTSDDKYRPSYGKTVESHPRQCIIIAKHHSRMCACVRVCARIHVNLWKLA
jgi:hypothetical protein